VVLLAATLAPFAVATVIGLLVLWPDHPVRADRSGIGLPANVVRATITAAVREPCQGDEQPAAEPNGEPDPADPGAPDPGEPASPTRGTPSRGRARRRSPACS
jgi:hypothetical protein